MIWLRKIINWVTLPLFLLCMVVPGVVIGAVSGVFIGAYLLPCIILEEIFEHQSGSTADCIGKLARGEKFWFKLW